MVKRHLGVNVGTVILLRILKSHSNDSHRSQDPFKHGTHPEVGLDALFADVFRFFSL